VLLILLFLLILGLDSVEPPTHHPTERSGGGTDESRFPEQIRRRLTLDLLCRQWKSAANYQNSYPVSLFLSAALSKKLRTEIQISAIAHRFHVTRFSIIAAQIESQRYLCVDSKKQFAYSRVARYILRRLGRFTFLTEPHLAS
jgi:hypothetical protein